MMRKEKGPHLLPFTSHYLADLPFPPNHWDIIKHNKGNVVVVEKGNKNICSTYVYSK